MAAPDPKAQMRRFLMLFPLCLLAGFGLLQVPAGGGGGRTVSPVCWSRLAAALIHAVRRPRDA